MTSAASARADRAARHLVVVFAAGGTAHLLTPSWFDAIIPPWLPGRPRAWTRASGASAFATAGALAHLRTRRLGGKMAVVFLVAVMPAKVQLSVNWLRDENAGPVRRAAAVLHHPWQIPLIRLAVAAQHRDGE